MAGMCCWECSCGCYSCEDICPDCHKPWEMVGLWWREGKRSGKLIEGSNAAQDYKDAQPDLKMKHAHRSEPFKCPVCEGSMWIRDTFYLYHKPGDVSVGSVPCRTCNGTGIVWSTT